MTATAALTTSVPDTTSQSAGSASGTFGDAIGAVFGNPNVQSSIGGAVNSVLQAGLDAVGVHTGLTPEQQAAQAAAAAQAAKAQQTQMLVIGGAIAAVVVTIIVVVVLMKRG